MRKATLAFAFIVWVSSWPAWGQPKGQPRDQQHPADSKAAQAQSDQRGSKDSPIFVHILQDPQGQADTAKTQNEDGNKPLYDALTAWGAVVAAFFTGLLVIVGFRGVRAANHTLEAIQAQGRLLAREFEFSHRPWVAVDVAITSPIASDKDLVYVNITCALRNTGNSPAIRTGIDITIDTSWEQEQLDSNWKAMCERPSVALANYINITLFPGGSPYPWKEPFTVQRKLLETNRDPSGRFNRLTIMGRVGYEYSFAKGQHFTPFIYEIHKTGGGGDYRLEFIPLNRDEDRLVLKEAVELVPHISLPKTTIESQAT